MNSPWNQKIYCLSRGAYTPRSSIQYADTGDVLERENTKDYAYQDIHKTYKLRTSRLYALCHLLCFQLLG